MSAVHIIFIYELKNGKINYYNAFFKESCTIIKIDRLIDIGNESKSTKITRLETEDTITTDPIEIINIDPLSQNLSGEDSTWMVDCLKIPRIVHCLFFYFMVDLLWLFQKMSCVLSCERENQIVVTISTFLHHIHVELEVTTPCLLSTVSVRYFLEMRA